MVLQVNTTHSYILYQAYATHGADGCCLVHTTTPHGRYYFSAITKEQGAYETQSYFLRHLGFR